jgi:hypothetical protein
VELNAHAVALLRVGSLPVPSVVYDVPATWLIDADGTHHARRHQLNDEMVNTNGILGEFLAGARCDTARCADWVHALGDHVIVAAQIAVAVSEAWDALQSFASGGRTGNRVESMQAITTPFDRAETITGPHALIEKYREVMVAAYAEHLEGYIYDLRQARVQILAAAVDHIARTQRNIFDNVDQLVGPHTTLGKPMTRGDLVGLRKKVDTFQPTHVAQLATLRLADLEMRESDAGVVGVVTSAWRVAVIDAVEIAITEIRALDQEFGMRSEQLAGVSSSNRPLPLPYRLSDIAHAFAWRPNARLAILPAALAAVLAPTSGWQMVDLNGYLPGDDVLEMCETLWDPASATYADLAHAYRAARAL